MVPHSPQSETRVAHAERGNTDKKGEREKERKKKNE